MKTTNHSVFSDLSFIILCNIYRYNSNSPVSKLQVYQMDQATTVQQPGEVCFLWFTLTHQDSRPKIFQTIIKLFQSLHPALGLKLSQNVERNWPIIDHNQTLCSSVKSHPLRFSAFFSLVVLFTLRLYLRFGLTVNPPGLSDRVTSTRSWSMPREPGQSLHTHSPWTIIHASALLVYTAYAIKFPSLNAEEGVTDSRSDNGLRVTVISL